MPDNSSSDSPRVALVTGAARRIGASIARSLHAAGMNIVIHYHTSRNEAQALQSELNAERPESVILIQTDLAQQQKLASLIREAAAAWQRLDVVVNNASVFYPTPIFSTTEKEWDELMLSNLKAPFFICQAAAEQLREQRGCIINILDIHHDRPLKNHAVYCIAKAGLAMLTKSLARELGPDVRVNAVAPGSILWPENDMDDVTRQRILSRTVLKRQGLPEDIATAVRYLALDADYITGQIIAVDGGRTLSN